MTRARAARWLGLAAGLALVLGCAAGASLQGAPAPAFTAVDVAGRPVDLAYFRNQRHVVLVFYIGHT